MRVEDGTAAIIGMGVTGRSVARYLTARGVPCTAFDERRVELPSDLNLPLRIGGLDAGKLAEFDFVVVSPGVPWSHPALEELRRRGRAVMGDIDLFVDQFEGELLAVTGTNGKTTTVRLIATLLETLPGGIDAAGNIGEPMLDLLNRKQLPERVVLELSSFQLERCAHIRPRWAVLLNLQSDHADMHGDAAAYRAAKLRLFDAQGDGDGALLPAGEEWNALAGELAGRGVRVLRFGIANGQHEGIDAGVETDGAQARLFWHEGEIRHVIPVSELRVRGGHQHLNLAVAAQMAATHDVPAGLIREALTTFPGLAHRLQHIGRHRGREWFDDSKATNPEAARAALASFDRVLWICGGLAKGVDLEGLAETVRERVAHAFVIGRDAKRFAAMLREAGVPHTQSGRLERAVRHADAFEEPLPVLLSPAAASQDQFRDYAERGRHFSDAVRELEVAS